MDRVGIVGAGNMGESILKALLKRGVEKNDLCFIEAKKERALYIANTYGIDELHDVAELTKRSDKVVLAVKPQDAGKVLPEIGSSFTDSNILISIMAGITISKIISLAGRSIRVVRMMPNVAIKVNQGVIGITASADVSADEFSAVRSLFSSAGLIVDVDEGHMDAITSLGASSPAFFLLFLEGMIDAGVHIGLTRDKAKAISIQVVRGVIEMLEQEQMHPALMREMITSPGGTTISGLATLEAKAFKGNIIKAIEKASLRAKELSS
ncbi:MAG: pyrroline-5-carboxylate reductase [Syntrophorhabdaceae bacterium]|nr:pyrroline-5-carboxylate reductase [Syntrophorhabdaceae bacterium]MDD4195762.1 pyrroline-5-carboxylate reductase [Syntrophorhabdaceae bacterium]HOC45232.1 pyrroline-5-carboxylate reductase [Syntrophorhabdaceae bacterium]